MTIYKLIHPIGFQIGHVVPSYATFLTHFLKVMLMTKRGRWEIWPDNHFSSTFEINLKSVKSVSVKNLVWFWVLKIEKMAHRFTDEQVNGTFSVKISQFLNVEPL